MKPPKIEEIKVAMNPVQGQIIATCGHEITIEEVETGGGYLARHDGESLVLSYGVYCPRCLKERVEEFAKGRRIAEPVFNLTENESQYLEITPDEAKLMILLIGWSSSIWQNPSSIVMEGNRVKRQDIQKLSGKLLVFLQIQES